MSQCPHWHCPGLVLGRKLSRSERSLSWTRAHPSKWIPRLPSKASAIPRHRDGDLRLLSRCQVSFRTTYDHWHKICARLRGQGPRILPHCRLSLLPQDHIRQQAALAARGCVGGMLGAYATPRSHRDVPDEQRPPVDLAIEKGAPTGGFESASACLVLAGCWRPVASRRRCGRL